MNEDDDKPVIVVQQKRRSVASTLFKHEANDSVLKDVVVWGLALGGAYFGGRFLMGTVKEDVKDRRENRAIDAVLTAAETGKNPVAVAAERLALALNPEWRRESPKVAPSMWVDADEVTIFELLAGPVEKNFYGGVTVKRYAPIINSRESYQAVSTAYKSLTGRTLDYDLANNLDAIGKGDYEQLRPYISQIKCHARVVDPKTKRVTIKKVC